MTVLGFAVSASRLLEAPIMHTYCEIRILMIRYTSLTRPQDCGRAGVGEMYRIKFT